jgi:hypothetical protein
LVPCSHIVDRKPRLRTNHDFLLAMMFKHLAHLAMLEEPKAREEIESHT